MTQAPGRLLPTIRSRCQQVRFGALRPATVTELLLRDRALPSDVAAAIAALSQGQMARALDLVDSEKREVVLDVTRRLHDGDDPMSVSEEFAAHLKSQADAIKDSITDMSAAEKEEFGNMDKDEMKKELLAAAEAVIRRDMMEYLYLFQTWYRDGMVYGATQAQERLLNQDQTARLAKEARGASEDKLAAIGTAWIYIERNLSIDRVFRDLFLKLAA
jgi:DNA polymerase III delta prime subunit